MDLSKWFVPIALLPGATVLFLNMQGHIRVSAASQVVVETPAPSGWKGPEIVTAPCSVRSALVQAIRLNADKTSLH